MSDRVVTIIKEINNPIVFVREGDDIVKRTWRIVTLFICIIMAMVCMFTACSTKEEQDKDLTLEKVKELSKKGNDLSRSDFEKYESKDIGSGNYILMYGIDKEYKLLIGGSSKEEEPDYIRLVKNDNEDEYVDIRTENVEGFISN